MNLTRAEWRFLQALADGEKPPAKGSRRMKLRNAGLSKQNAHGWHLTPYGHKTINQQPRT